MVNIQQYNYSPHPFILPNFMNIFNWSIPFVSEKISEMLLHIIKKDPSMDEGNDTSRALDENISNSLREYFIMLKNEFILIIYLDVNF